MPGSRSEVLGDVVPDDWRDRTTLTVDETCPILGVGRNTLYASIKRGEVLALTLGHRLVIPVAPLRRQIGETP
jgi:excisionase family DNA binding protein